MASCSPPSPETGVENNEPEVAATDSTAFTLTLQYQSDKVRQLDLFIFSASGTKPLEKHVRYDSAPEKISLMLPVGEKVAAAIANSPKAFNLTALSRYDALEQLEYSFTDDDPSYPIMSGTTDGDTLVLKPMMCCVILASVSNGMDGYELIESPRVRLTDLTMSAKVMQESEFRPSETLDAGDWKDLPSDIGFYTQRPMTAMYCYPNDTPETTLGTPHIGLELQCTIQSETCSFDVALPPLNRGDTLRVDLNIDGPSTYTSTVK